MIIFRYFTKQIFTTMIGIALVLLLIFITSQSVRFFQSAATGMLPLSGVLHLILLQVPLLLGYLLPLALYLAILSTLGRLYLDSEITVLFACGFSRLQLLRMFLGMGLAVAGVVLWLMMFVLPGAQRDVNAVYQNAARRASIGKILPGKFLDLTLEKENAIFYAKKVNKQHTLLEEVFLARKDVDEAHPNVEPPWDVVIAKKAFEAYVSGQHDPALVLEKGHRYVGVPGEKAYRVMTFDQFGFVLKPGVGKNNYRDNQPQNYSMRKLWALQDTDKEAASELQWRLAMPISVFLLILIAVPLSEVNPRYGKFAQFFPALLIYVAYAQLILMARGWTSNSLSPALAMWIAHGSLFLVGILLNAYRAKWRFL